MKSAASNVCRQVGLVQPDAVVHAEAGVEPAEHSVGHFGVEELTLDERLQHASAERLGEHRRRVGRQLHEGAVGPEAAVGAPCVDVRLPVQQ